MSTYDVWAPCRFGSPSIADLYSGQRLCFWTLFIILQTTLILMHSSHIFRP